MAGRLHLIYALYFTKKFRLNFRQNSGQRLEFRQENGPKVVKIQAKI